MIHLIGIDCATQDAKIGLAFGWLEGETLAVEKAMVCSREQDAAARIVEQLRRVDRPVLIAVDAPLGWPEPMGRLLADHRAGGPLRIESSELFRRVTDRHIQEAIGKLPLDVGADRIARTAHTALGLLMDIREELRQPIGLAWRWDRLDPMSFIEVYPAATLKAAGIRSSGYKKREQVAERRGILDALRQREAMRLPEDLTAIEANADVLDATVCLLAAADFVRGRAAAPDDRDAARKEGWIWCRARDMDAQ